ncbi:hypothetical protein KJ365_13705 [Glaciecola sp. XM2]|jgi:hypothetical protein|uniref:hypothetical protein n=1 Tax=Glaciecola sp. XM2 TaxID=1914931 RepID=UPI001BDDFC91|nr:hypothetical protein [Glaciecola sp. XM2]MBT1451943.1 hypothetical protein [Glaciecola sp. XM2]
MNQTYTIIIILIAALIVAGIAASAVQQHNERKAAKKREEINKHRAVLEETEMAAGAAQHMPVSKLLISILRKRSLAALIEIYEQNPSPDLKSKVTELQKLIREIDVNEKPPELSGFKLPKSDKVIIKYIQAIKKLRIILRSERKKENITKEIFLREDKTLESLQLRVNIDTLLKRANDAVTNNMQGSARQYLEKAIGALVKHTPQDEYTTSRSQELTEMLNGLESSLKDKNVQNILEAKAREKEDIDTLFAPKKKW